MANDILVDQRNGLTVTIKGFDDLQKKLDDTNKAEVSAKMLKAAEPIIKGALDAEMTRHPGPLQQSLKSTGAKQNSRGEWFLAYRATTGNERASDNRTNPEKMVYLINREYIRKRKTKDGKTVNEYVIPADDVIGEAVKKCENSVIDAMQEAFNKALDSIW